MSEHEKLREPGSTPIPRPVRHLLWHPIVTVHIQHATKLLMNSELKPSNCFAEFFPAS
jgi:hypothetical protein